MATRTAFAGTAVDGAVLTGAQINRLPGGWIGYVESIAGQVGVGPGATDLTALTVSVTAGTSRRLKVTGRVTFNNNSAGSTFYLLVREGGTTLGRAAVTATTLGDDLHAFAIVTPSAGSHTYKLSAQSISGTFDLTTDKAWILVEDIGPAS